MIANTGKMIEQITADRDRYRSERDSCRSKKEENEKWSVQTITQLQQGMNEKDRKIEEYKMQRDQYRSKLEENDRIAKQTSQTVTQIQQGINQTQRQTEEFIAQRDRYQRERDQLRTTLDQYQNTVLKPVEESYKTEISKLVGERDTYRSKLEEYERGLASTKSTTANSDRMLATVKQQLTQVTEEREKYKRERDNFQMESAVNKANYDNCRLSNQTPAAKAPQPYNLMKNAQHAWNTRGSATRVQLADPTQTPQTLVMERSFSNPASNKTYYRGGRKSRRSRNSKRTKNKSRRN